MTEIVRQENSKPPALLFENIQDYPLTSRLITGIYNTARRLALTLRLPVDTEKKGVVVQWRRKIKSLAQIPPVQVKNGPILENVRRKERSIFSSSPPHCGTSWTAVDISERPHRQLPVIRTELDQSGQLSRDATGQRPSKCLDLTRQTRQGTSRQIFRAWRPVSGRHCPGITP